MNQEPVEEQDIQPSLGRALQVAREATELSIEDVAERLKLSPLQITQLEQDDYSKLGPVTFVKGYLKSYCNLLKLPVEESLALFQTPEVPASRKKMQSFSRRTEKEASDSRLMIISYVFLIIILGAPGIWWWQSSSENAEVKSSVPDPISGLPELTEQMEANDVGQKTAIPEMSELTEAEAGLAENNMNNTSSDAPTVDLQPQVNVAPEVVPESEENTTGVSTVVMRFSDDSWVEIFDATQERVAFGVKKAGYTMTVQGQPPFSVVLNKHLMVEVELDGKLIDLTALPKNRLAKFKLPLAE